MKQGNSVQHPVFGVGVYLGRQGEQYLFGFHQIGLQRLTEDGMGEVQAVADITRANLAIDLKAPVPQFELFEGLGGLAEGWYITGVDLGDGLVLTAVTLGRRQKTGPIYAPSFELNGKLIVSGCALWPGNPKFNGVRKVRVDNANPEHISIKPPNINGYAMVGFKANKDIKDSKGKTVKASMLWGSKAWYVVAELIQQAYELEVAK